MHSLVLCTLYISYSHQAEGSFNFYSGTLWHPHPLSSFSFTKRYHREFFLHRILSVFFIDITNWSKQQHYFYKICIAYGNICWVNHGIFHTVKKEILVELFGAQFQWTAERKHVTTKKQAPQFTGRSCALNNENLFSANAKKKNIIQSRIPSFTLLTMGHTPSRHHCWHIFFASNTHGLSSTALWLFWHGF